MESEKTKINSKTKKVLIASAMFALALATTGTTIFVLSQIDDKKNTEGDTSIFGGFPENSAPITYGKTDSDKTENGEKKNDDEKKVKEEDLPDTLPETTKEHYEESEVAFEKKITTTERISFSTTTTNEANLPRGKVVVSQNGIEGAKKLTFLVKYNSKGESLAIEKIAEEVLNNPVTQVEKVGTSDFNLNERLTVSTYASGVCLTSDADANGCRKESESYQFATAFSLQNVFYVTQIQANDGIKSLFSRVSGGTFSYNGETWVFETRFLRNSSELSEEFCSVYGFSCGRW